MPAVFQTSVHNLYQIALPVDQGHTTTTTTLQRRACFVPRANRSHLTAPHALRAKMDSRQLAERRRAQSWLHAL